MVADSSQYVIVTGGNRGIGYEICRKLASSGRPVLLCSRDKQAGTDAARRIGTEIGNSGRCIAKQLDVTDTKSIDSFISEVAEAYDQRIFALVNNAAVYPDGWTQRIFNMTMLTNFVAPMQLAHALAPHMVKGGRIIHVTSELGLLGNLSAAYRKRITAAKSIAELRKIPFDPGDNFGYKPTYCLSKAMINRASLLMSQLPEFQHLSVNAADPGWCRTDGGGPGAPRSAEQGANSILAVLNFPRHIQGGVFTDGKPQKI